MYGILGVVLIFVIAALVVQDLFELSDQYSKRRSRR